MINRLLNSRFRLVYRLLWVRGFRLVNRRLLRRILRLIRRLLRMRGFRLINRRLLRRIFRLIHRWLQVSVEEASANLAELLNAGLGGSDND